MNHATSTAEIIKVVSDLNCSPAELKDALSKIMDFPECMVSVNIELIHDCLPSVTVKYRPYKSER